MSLVRPGQPYALRNLSCGFPLLWEHRPGSFISRLAKISGRMDHYNVKFLNITRSGKRKRQICCRRQEATLSASDEQTVFQARGVFRRRHGS
jgi:hypothetical protein